MMNKDEFRGYGRGALGLIAIAAATELIKEAKEILSKGDING